MAEEKKKLSLEEAWEAEVGGKKQTPDLSFTPDKAEATTTPKQPEPGDKPMTLDEAWSQFAEPEVGKLNRGDRMLQGFSSGFTGAAGTFAGGLQMLQDLAGNAPQSGALGMPDVGREAKTAAYGIQGPQPQPMNVWEKTADSFEQIAGDLAAEDPTLYDNVAQGLGSFAFYMLPGIGASKGIGALGTVAPKAARMVGAVSGGTMEGFAEGGDVYRKVLEETGDQAKAAAAAGWTMLWNIPLDILTDKIGYFSESPAMMKVVSRVLDTRLGRQGASETIAQAMKRSGGLLRGGDDVTAAIRRAGQQGVGETPIKDLIARVVSQMGAGALSEGTQEPSQGLISEKHETGKPWGEVLQPENIGKHIAAETPPAMIVGALGGGVSGAAQHMDEADDRFDRDNAARISNMLGMDPNRDPGPNTINRGPLRPVLTRYQLNDQEKDLILEQAQKRYDDIVADSQKGNDHREEIAVLGKALQQGRDGVDHLVEAYPSLRDWLEQAQGHESGEIVPKGDQEAENEKGDVATQTEEEPPAGTKTLEEAYQEEVDGIGKPQEAPESTEVAEEGKPPAKPEEEASAPAEEPQKPKEPWEMTREEYDAPDATNALMSSQKYGSRKHEFRARAEDRLAGLREMAESFDEKTVDKLLKGKTVTEEPDGGIMVWSTPGVKGTKFASRESAARHFLDGRIRKAEKDIRDPYGFNPNLPPLEHREVVENALRRGKTVPPEVLKEYPDLAKKYGQNVTENVTPSVTPEPLQEQGSEDNTTPEMSPEMTSPVSTEAPARAQQKAPELPWEKDPRDDEYAYFGTKVLVKPADIEAQDLEPGTLFQGTVERVLRTSDGKNLVEVRLQGQDGTMRIPQDRIADVVETYRDGEVVDEGAEDQPKPGAAKSPQKINIPWISNDRGNLEVFDTYSNQPLWWGTLGDFLDENDFDAQEIRDGIKRDGYYRLGADNSILVIRPRETGAGNTFGDTSQTEGPAGKKATVKTDDGTQVETQYALVEADDLIASHTATYAENPDYPSELQPRERSRAAGQSQVERIVSGLDPERLGESLMASEGAPIVGPDMVVESGNGRTMAIRTSYDRNTEGAEKYRKWLEANAGQFGLNAQDVANHKKPVLVRVRTSEVDRAAFARSANQSTVGGMSASEQAISDAKQITGDMLGRFAPSDNGDIVSGNGEFIRLFRDIVVKPNEMNSFVDSKGKISQTGINRIRNAVFAKAYGDSDAVGRMAESVDDNIKNVISGMLLAAPKMAQMEEGIANGTLHPLSIAKDLIAAADKLSDLRAAKISVDEYFQQATLFDTSLSPNGNLLLRLLDSQKRSARKIATILNDYASAVMSKGDPRMKGFFEENAPTVAETLEAVKRRNGIYDKKGQRPQQGSQSKLNLRGTSDQGGSSAGVSEKTGADRQRQAAGDSEQKVSGDSFEQRISGVIDQLAEKVVNRKNIRTWFENSDSENFSRTLPGQIKGQLADITTELVTEGNEYPNRAEWVQLINSIKDDAVMDRVVRAVMRKLNAGEEESSSQVVPVSRDKYAETRDSQEQQWEKGKALEDLAGKISNFIEKHRTGQKGMTSKQLFEMANEVFGGTQAEGVYTPKDAYDALELGVNMYIWKEFDNVMDMPAGAARNFVVKEIQEKIMKALPTQTKRTEETNEFQQFSTPWDLSYVAAWVANIKPGDIVLEPSAGTGNLAIWAKNAGATVYTNELSDRRAEALRLQGYQVFRENAEHINAILGNQIQPTVILMNPPFSSTAGRIKGKRDTKNAHKHIEEALKILAPGGRLVAIVGKGMAYNTSHKAWWDKIGKQYTVRFNVGIDGESYRKMGTTWGVQLVVIDKVKGGEGDMVSGAGIPDQFDSPEKILGHMEGYRNDRQAVTEGNEGAKPASAEPGDSAGTSGTGEASGRRRGLGPQSDDGNVSGDASAVGDGTGRGGSHLIQPDGEVVGEGLAGGNDSRSGPEKNPEPLSEEGRGPSVGELHDSGPGRPEGGEPGGDAGDSLPDHGRESAESGGVEGHTGDSVDFSKERLEELKKMAARDMTRDELKEMARLRFAERKGQLKTKAQIVAENMNEAKAALQEAAAIFANHKRRGSLGHSEEVDESLYQEIKPHLSRAWSSLVKAGNGAIEFMDLAMDIMGESAISYLDRFLDETVKDQPPEQEETHEPGPAKPKNTTKTRSKGGKRKKPEVGTKEETTPPPAKKTTPAPVKKTAVKKAEKTPAKKKEEFKAFDEYVPTTKIEGAKPHPAKLVESSALADVEVPPLGDIDLRIPQDLISDGKLSEAQLEAISYYARAAQTLLPGGIRQGFLIGDGTGVGKGREISGVILDSFQKGQKKALWISATPKLFPDAVRDWTALGGDEKEIFHLGVDIKSPKKQIPNKSGICFMGYSTLSAQLKVADQGKVANKYGVKRSRYDQIREWLGEDFDGVIVFDEAHEMGNNIAVKQERGFSKPSVQGTVGVEIQRMYPKAHILYVSATAATTVMNLGYAERFGLWGPETPFENKADFMATINRGGMAAMEAVCRELKARGLYISRNISYDGVEYERVVHSLTENQQKTYDIMADAWRTVMFGMEQTIKELGMDSNDAKNARSSFWSSQQRFFNNVLASLQMPTMLKRMHEDLDNGMCPVIQLTSTNEAAMDRELLKLTGESGLELEDLDMTPRGILLSFLDNYFPVSMYEESMDPETGAISRNVVRDSNGNIVQDPDAVAKREALKKKVMTIPVPESPLDILIEEFGADNVAEVTGRSRRIVQGTKKNGTKGLIIEKRTPAIAEQDAVEFAEGKRKVLVFSQAGGTGKSYHADRTIKNQARRVHYVLQPGWEADKAMQGLGRTHRSNESSQPIYRLMMTDIKGHMRFMSSIAKRIGQLGALTKGSRSAAGQGVFSEKDNLESQYATSALNSLYSELQSGSAKLAHLYGPLVDQMAVRTNPKDGRLIPPSVKQFLNRILMLNIKEQNEIFEEFYKRMEDDIQHAIEIGTYDTGMMLLKADTINISNDSVIRVDPKTGVETHYVKLDVGDNIEPLGFDEARDMDEKIKFVTNKRSGRIYALRPAGTKALSNGDIVPRFRLYSVAKDMTQYITEGDLGKYETIDSEAEARRQWDAAVAKLPKYSKRTMHLITGSLLPIWKMIGGSETKVYRVQTDDGQRLIGRVVKPSEIRGVLKSIGADESVAEAQDPMAVVMGGGQIRTASGWTIQKVRVADEPRIEIAGRWVLDAKDTLESWGCFTEIINHRGRIFVPRNDKGKSILTKIIQTEGLASMEEGDQAEDIDALLEAQEDAAEPVQSLDSLNNDVSEITNAEKSTDGPPAGMSIRLIWDPRRNEREREEKALIDMDEFMSDKPQPFEYQNPEMEAAHQVGVKGIQKDPVKVRFSNWLNEVHKWTSRTYRNLPHDKFHAEAIESLRYLAAQVGESQRWAVRYMEAITKDLTPEDMDLFTRYVYLQDFMAEAEEGHDLPYGMDPKDVVEELDRLQAHVDENAPHVMDAVRLRKKIWASVKANYINAAKKVGVNLEKRFTKTDYFRHQVLAHMKDGNGSFFTAGKKLQAPMGRGFLKKREGSNMAINLNYFQAEFEVLAQMLYDAKMYQTIDRIGSNYDVKDLLKAQARDLNRENVIKVLTEWFDKSAAPGEEMTPREMAEKEFRAMGQKQAIALSRLAKMADELPTGEHDEWADVIDSLVEYAHNKAEEKEALGEDASGGGGVLDSRLFAYLNYLGSLSEEGASDSEKQAKILSLMFWKGVREKKANMKEILKGAKLKYYDFQDGSWYGLIPEGYRVWQPRPGSVFYKTFSIPEEVALEIADKSLKELGLGPEVVRQVIAKGGKFREMVLPEEIADQLDQIEPEKDHSPFFEANRKLIKDWKWWVLYNPKRFVKYEFRNFTGDIEAPIIANGGTFKHFMRATDELYQFIYNDREGSKEFQDWIERGGMQAIQRIQELGDLNKLKQFGKFLEDKDKSTWEKAKDRAGVNWYVEKVNQADDLREGILRFATYLSYLEQIKASENGTPKNFGASLRDEIMGLKDPRDRAFRLSNELLGAYDEISEFGRSFRENFFPFWSFQEINFVRYKRLIQNAYIDGATAGKVGAKVGGSALKASPFIAMRVGRFAIKASLLWAVLQAWNLGFHPDEEKDLPSDVRSRPHLVFGRTPEGKVIYFSRLGILGDFTEWFGMDAPQEYVHEWLNGRMSVADIAKEMAKSPVNKVVNGMHPFVKGGVELLAGKSTYPDAFKMRTIRDRGQYLANQFSLGEEYRAIFGKPQPGGRYLKPDLLIRSVAYEIDPLEVGYWDTMELKYKFLERIGKAGGYGAISPKSKALWYFKQALRYRDKKAADKYLAEYASYGGTKAGLKRSLQSMDPFYGLKPKEARKFYSELSGQERVQLQRAIKFYEKMTGMKSKYH